MEIRPSCEVAGVDASEAAALCNGVSSDTAHQKSFSSNSSHFPIAADFQTFVRPLLGSGSRSCWSTVQVGVAKHARLSSCVQRTPQQKLPKPISNPTKAKLHNAPKRHETLSHHDTTLFVTASSLLEEPCGSSRSCTTSSIARPRFPPIPMPCCHWLQDWDAASRR